MRNLIMLGILINITVLTGYGQKGSEINSKISNPVEITKVPNQYIFLFSTSTFQPFEKTEQHQASKTNLERVKALSEYNRSMKQEVLNKFKEHNIEISEVKNFTTAGQVMIVVKTKKEFVELAKASMKDATILQDQQVITSASPPKNVKERDEQLPAYEKEALNKKDLESIGAFYTSGRGKNVFIISGFIPNHDDINVNRQLSASFLPSDETPASGLGMAGIVAAKDNNIGIKGIASDATVIDIGALATNEVYFEEIGFGKYYFSWFLSALAYTNAITLPGQVIVIDNNFNYTFQSTVRDGKVIDLTESLTYAELLALENMVITYVKSLGLNGKQVCISANYGYLNTRPAIHTLLGKASTGKNIYFIAGHIESYGSPGVYNCGFSYFGTPIDYSASERFNTYADVPGQGRSYNFGGRDYHYEDIDNPAAIFAGMLIVNNGKIRTNGKSHPRYFSITNAINVTYVNEANGQSTIQTLKMNDRVIVK